MIEVTAKSRLSFGLKLLSAGFNLALFAASNPAFAHGGAPQGSPAFNHQFNGHQPNFSGIAPHFGSPGSLGLIHPHGQFGALAGSLPLATSNIVTLPTAALASGVQLDLGSSATSVVLPSGFISHGSQVTILVGGASKTFQAGDSVSAGELVAITQVRSGGQKIVLDGQGRADGGSFSLNGILSAGAPLKISGIVIPQNVSALDYVSAKANFNLSGDLVNYGSIVDISKGGQKVSTNLSALDIVNESGGLITTMGQGAHTSAADLSLNAVDNFTNLGTVTSSGYLSVSAGGILTNGGTAGGGVPAPATINAVKDVSLQSANIVNSGLISSTGGNINLAAGGTQNLTVNNSSGTLSAIAGAINVRGAGYAGGANTNVTGGDLLSQSLNLNAGAGTINVNVNELTGAVNSAGNAVHVEANTSDLVLGSQHLSGDPTFYNPGGSIVLNGDIIVSEDLAIIAGGSITATSALTQITTVDGGGQGHNIYMIAGAQVSGAGGDTTSGIPTPGTAATGQVTVTGPNTQGGNIDLTGASGILSISSASTGAGLKGGDITMVALGFGAGTGQILLPGASNLDASGGGGGAGNVTLMATPAFGSAIGIVLGSITHGGTSVGANNVQILNYDTLMQNNQPLVFATNGSVVSGAIVPNYTFAGAGTLEVSGPIIASGQVRIAGGNHGDVQIGGDISGQSIAIVSGVASNIVFNGSLQAPGGITLVSGLNVTAASPSLSISTSSTGFACGGITIITGVNVQLSDTTIKVTGFQNNGNIDFSVGLAALSTNSTGTGGSGGDITLVASDIVQLGSGQILLGSTPTVTSGGAGGGPNGSVTLISGSAASGGISAINGVDVTGGQTGTGNIAISYSLPNVSFASPVIISTGTGSIISGSFLNPLVTPANGGGVPFGPLTIDGGNLLIHQAALTVSGPLATGAIGNLILEANGGIAGLTIQTPLAANSVTLLSGRDVVFGSGAAVTSPGGLTVVAGGNIKTTAGGVSISTASGSGNGGDITMVAGASYTLSGSTVTVTGQFITGLINFATSPLAGLSSQSTTGTGGNITLVAFGNGLGPSIQIPSALTVQTSGAVSNGSFMAVAGQGNASSDINIGKVDTATGGASDGSGAITLQSNTPNITMASPLVVSTSGTILQGNPLNPTPDGTSGSIVTGNLTTAGAQVLVDSGKDIQLANVTAGSTLLLAVGNITLGSGASVVSPGGVGIIAGGNIVTNGGGSIDTSSIVALPGGAITIMAGATFQLSSNAVQVSGASSTGGGIDLSAGGGLTTLSSQCTGSGNGGNITMVAFSGTGPTSGQIVLPAALTVETSGTGGNNGNFTAVAGQTTGAIPAISIGNVDLSAGGTRGGSGLITLESATPNTDSPLVIDFSGNLTGSPINEGFGGAASDVIAGNLSAMGSSAFIEIVSSRNVQLGNLDVSAPSGSFLSGGGVQVVANGTTTLQIGSATGVNFITSINASGDTTIGTRGQISIFNMDPSGAGIGGITLVGTPITNNGVTGGGSLSLVAGSAASDILNLGTNTTFTYDSGVGNQAGAVTFIAAGVTWTNIGKTSLTVTAAQGSVGTGGTITYETNTPALNLTASAPLHFDASGGGMGTGGTVVIENGGNVTYDPTAVGLINLGGALGAGNLTIKAGFFNDLQVGAPNANLLVTGTLSLSGAGSGSGGGVNLTSSSATPFNIGLVTGNNNGVQGAISVAGAGGGTNGSITISNANGGITTSVALTAFNSAAFSAGGTLGNITIGAPLGSAGATGPSSITLSAGGFGSIIQTSSKNVVSVGTVASDSVTFHAVLGSVGGKTAFAVNAPTMQIGVGGTVNVSDSSAVTLNNSSSGSNSSFTLTSPGVITTGQIVAGTAVSLSGSGEEIGGQVIAAAQSGIVAITATTGSIMGSVGGEISGTASVALTAPKGGISIDTIGTATDTAPGTVAVTALNGFAVTGDVRALNSITIKTTAMSGPAADVAVGGAVFAQSSTGAVTITSSNGSITNSSNSDYSAGKSVTLSAAKGSITFATIGGSGPTGAATLTALNNITSSGSLDAINSITAKTTTASTSGTVGLINFGGQVETSSATSGVILLTATGTTSATGAITLFGNSVITGSKSVTLSAAKGSIEMGAIGNWPLPSGTVSLSALNNISAGPINALNAVTVKTAASSATTGNVFIIGPIVALSPSGTVSITGTGSSSSAIQAALGADISAGKSVTLTAAKGGIAVDQVGVSLLTSKVVISALSAISTGSMQATTSLAETVTAKTAGAGITVNGTVMVPSLSGTVALTANSGDITDGVSDIISAGKSVTLSAPAAVNGITIDGGISTSAGAISVIGSGKSLTVGAGAQITANGAAKATKATIFLENKNTTSGNITFASGANIATSGLGGGNVTVSIGAPPSKGITNATPPAGIKVNGPTTSVFFGPTGVLVPASTGTININGASVIFNAPAALLASISLTNTTITADPPASIAPASSTSGSTAGSIAGATLLMAPAAVSNVLSPVASTSMLQNQLQLFPQAQLGFQSYNVANTALGATAQQTINLQGSAEINAPKYGQYNWISETEIDGGEIPVSLLSDVELGVGGDTGAEYNVVASAASGRKVVELSRGSVLSVPTVDTKIKTPYGDISVAAKSIVLIMALEHGVAVYNFHDTHKDAVVIEVAGKNLSVRPGASALVVPEHVRSFAPVNPAQLVCYRHMIEQQLENGMKAFRAEFSMQSAIEAIKPLKTMILSKQKETSRVAERFLKTTAILMQLQGGGEGFRQVMNPQMTAYRQ